MDTGRLSSPTSAPQRLETTSALAAELDALVEQWCAGHGATHDEIVRATCDLFVGALGFEECWLQQPSPLAREAAGWAARDGGAWTANPVASEARGARHGMGAMGAAPVHVHGELVGTLMVWSSVPRAWSSRDRAALREAAALLGSALADTATSQRTDRDLAVAELEALRSELITTLNHELRTPLTSLLAGLEMLEDGAAGELDPRQLRLLGRLQHNVVRLQELADNVTRLTAEPVDPARWDRAGVEAVPDLFALVGRSVADLPVAGRDLVLDVEAPAEPVAVEMPEEDVRELLDRVLTNAVKFTPDGGRVRVATGMVTARTVELVVSDTGCGVPVQESRGLGRTFFRSSTARRDEKQGSGLGLAAATRLVEGWGGSLAITATEGVGTHVCLTLPLVRAEATDAGQDAGTDQVAQAGTEPGTAAWMDALAAEMVAGGVGSNR